MNTTNIIFEYIPNNQTVRKLLEFISTNNYIQNEQIREIPNTNAKYFATSEGRIISLCYNKAKVLKPYICGSGYYYIEISSKNKKVHRLIAKAFIPNPDNKPIAHHINGNKLDNRVCNLCWVSYEEHGILHRTKDNA